MPNIRQLKYVIKTLEIGSINEAAKQLFVSQPSLSNALKTLEFELDIKIFNRSAKGVSLTEEGIEFMVYARQIVEQVALMETKYQHKAPPRRLLSISCQHYAFAVYAFVELLKNYAQAEYELTLRETETHNILNDLSTFRSEIGLLYTNEFNKQVLEKTFKEKQLEFTPLFIASPHIFTGKNNPLAKKSIITLEDLAPYPCITYEQGNANSFYYSEEILSTRYSAKSIKVSDRATMFNLMVGVNGYTISSGVLSMQINDDNIIVRPLAVEEEITIGWLKHKQMNLSPLAQEYLKYLKHHIEEFGFDIIGSR